MIHLSSRTTLPRRVVGVGLSTKMKLIAVPSGLGFLSVTVETNNVTISGPFGKVLRHSISFGNLKLSC